MAGERERAVTADLLRRGDVFLYRGDQWAVIAADMHCIRGETPDGRRNVFFQHVLARDAVVLRQRNMQKTPPGQTDPADDSLRRRKRGILCGRNYDRATPSAIRWWRASEEWRAGKLAFNRRYRKEHPEKFAEYGRRARAKGDPARRREYNRRSYIKHREERLAYGHEYYAANIDKRRAYRAANADAIRERRARYYREKLKPALAADPAKRQAARDACKRWRERKRRERHETEGGAV